MPPREAVPHDQWGGNPGESESDMSQEILIHTPRSGHQPQPDVDRNSFDAHNQMNLFD
jgi:hypothetical protein